MNLEKKKENLVRQFNEIEQNLNQLAIAREQIRGKLMLLEEQEKEQEEELKKELDKETKKNEVENKSK